jgi:hypothetical protein
MNSFEDFPSFMVRLTCVECKNVFWVPEFEEIPRIPGVDIGLPTFCTYCGCEFVGLMEEE